MTGETFTDGVRLRQLEHGDFFLTRLTKRHGMVHKKEIVILLPEAEQIAAVAVELMGEDGILHQKLLHPDVRVDRIDVESPPL